MRARARVRARVRANRIGGPLGATVDEDIGHVRLQLRLQPYVSGAGGCTPLVIGKKGIPLLLLLQLIVLELHHLEARELLIGSRW